MFFLALQCNNRVLGRLLSHSLILSLSLSLSISLSLSLSLPLAPRTLCLCIHHCLSPSLSGFVSSSRLFKASSISVVCFLCLQSLSLSLYYCLGLFLLFLPLSRLSHASLMFYVVWNYCLTLSLSPSLSIYIYIYAVKLLSGPSLAFSGVIVWSKVGSLSGPRWGHYLVQVCF